MKVKKFKNYSLSVIVPVYNTGQYLHKCLTSITEQTWPVSEIIVIDDGSTDDSGKIAMQMASADSRIHVIRQENRGIAAARNAGLDNASGEYITFVDSDDYVDKMMYQRLFENLQNDGSDISICGVTVIYPDGTTYLPYKEAIRKTWNRREALIELNSYKYFNMSFCDRIIRRDLFEQLEDGQHQPLRFPLGKKCEDFYLMHKVIARAHKVSYTSAPFYFYYQRENSISRNKVIETAQIDAAKEQLKFYKKNFPDLSYIAETAYAFANIAVYTEYLRQKQECPKELRKRIQREAGKNLKSVLRNKHIPAIKRLQAFIFCTCPKLYDQIMIDKKHR